MRPSSAGKLVGTMATETITVVFTDLVGSTVQGVRAGDLAVLEFGSSAKVSSRGIGMPCAARL
jgi:hypothetical protein